jgi:4-amino-4-deoxy-L-arabinose transferase-like glycosyltransferase
MFNVVRHPALQLFLLLVISFSIRLYNIDKPPLDFSPVRQYQNAHIARGIYLENQKAVPEWRKQIAKLNTERMGFVLEPRFMEYLTVLGYRFFGNEHLWIPRVLSAVFWMIGGILLFLAVRLISSQGAAFTTTSFYLFLPYSISASRSFQPDPLMIMLVILSIYMVLKYFQSPLLLKLIIAAIVSTLALLIKPYSVFIIFGAFISVAIFRMGISKALINRDVIVFILLSIVPAASYYFHGLMNDTGFLREHTHSAFVPHLLFRPYFWKDWLTMIGRVVGYIPFAAALIGYAMTRNGTSKALLSGLWIGYIVFGIVFTFHIHTHSYYHLLLIPVVALSLGLFVDRMAPFIKNTITTRKKVMIIGALISAPVVVTAGAGLLDVKLRENKEKIKMFGSIVGINPEFYSFLTKDYKKEVAAAREIGKIVEHNTNTLFLTPDFGRSLAYHGEISGRPWPLSKSLKERQERKIRIPDKSEIFAARHFVIRTHGVYTKYTPDYFIITAFDELEKQADLKNYLTSNFSKLAESEDYLIFDLRRMTEQS